MITSVFTGCTWLYRLTFSLFVSWIAPQVLPDYRSYTLGCAVPAALEIPRCRVTATIGCEKQQSKLFAFFCPRQEYWDLIWFDMIWQSKKSSNNPQLDLKWTFEHQVVFATWGLVMPCGSPGGWQKQDAPAKRFGSQHLAKPATTTAGEPWTDRSDTVSGSFWTSISTELWYDFVELLTCSCHSFDLLKPFALEDCSMLWLLGIGDESKVAIQTKTLQGQWLSGQVALAAAQSYPKIGSDSNPDRTVPRVSLVKTTR